MREDGFPQHPIRRSLRAGPSKHRIGQRHNWPQRLIPVWYQWATIDDEARAEPVRSREGVTGAWGPNRFVPEFVPADSNDEAAWKGLSDRSSAFAGARRCCATCAREGVLDLSLMPAGDAFAGRCRTSTHRSLRGLAAPATRTTACCHQEMQTRIRRPEGLEPPSSGEVARTSESDRCRDTPRRASARSVPPQAVGRAVPRPDSRTRNASRTR